MEALPQFEMDRAKEKQNDIGKLVYHIKTQCKKVEDETDTLKDLFICHQLTDQNKDGLLTTPQSDFLDCFKFDRQKIYKFLD